MGNVGLEDIGLEDLAEKQNLIQSYLDDLPAKALGLGIRVAIVVLVLLVG